MDKLSDELICSILEYIPYDKPAHKLLCNNTIISKIRKNILNNYVNKIKKWWKHNNFIEDLEKLEKNNKQLLLKKHLIKFYIFHYDKDYLHGFPEFYMKKIHDFQSEMVNYSTNLNNSLKKYYIKMSSNKIRTYHVYNFLKLKDVTCYSIMMAGW